MLAWGLAVFTFGLIPPPYAPPSDLGTGLGDTAAHGAAFGVLALLASRLPELCHPPRRLLLGGAGLLLLAGLLEIAQIPVGRAAQLSDWIGGALGILAALGGRGLAALLARRPSPLPCFAGKRVESPAQSPYTGTVGQNPREAGRGSGSMTVMHRYVPVARVAEIPEGKGLRVQVEGHKVVLFHIDGEFHAFEDFCHQGADLSQGVVSEEGDVLCPLHGWRFDVHQGVCSMVPDCRVNRFPVRIEGERLLVGLA